MSDRTMSSSAASHHAISWVMWAGIAVLGAFAFAGIALNHNEPVSAAWLSGVAPLFSGSGRLPALAILEPGLGLLSSVRGLAGALPFSGASSASFPCGASGCLFSSAI